MVFPWISVESFVLNINTSNYMHYNAVDYRSNVQAWKLVIKPSLQFGASPPPTSPAPSIGGQFINKKTKKWVNRILNNPANSTEQAIKGVFDKAHNHLNTFSKNNPQATSDEVLIAAHKSLHPQKSIPTEQLQAASIAEHGADKESPELEEESIRLMADIEQNRDRRLNLTPVSTPPNQSRNQSPNPRLRRRGWNA